MNSFTFSTGHISLSCANTLAIYIVERVQIYFKCKKDRKIQVHNSKKRSQLKI